MTIGEAKKLVPSSFRIACQYYTVTINERGSCFGNFETLRNNINLYLNVLDDNDNYYEISEIQFKATWYHELAHCIEYIYNTECNEEFAQAFSNFMLEFEETKN